MLEAILILSAALSNFADVAVVAVLLVVNATVEATRERRASGVVEALRVRLRVAARVLRDSARIQVASRELVAGDTVRVRMGDVVPADLKLLNGALAVDQSALTGESKKAEVAAGGTLLSGSLVRRGEGDGLVTAHGGEDAVGLGHADGEAGSAQIAHRDGRRQGGALAFPHRGRAARGHDGAHPGARREPARPCAEELAKRGVLVTRLGAA